MKLFFREPEKTDSGIFEMRFGLREATIKQIIDVFRANLLIYEAIIYGSRAKGTCKPGSDIDVTLKGEQLNLTELNKIGLALDDLLLPYTFDLSIYHYIDNPDFIDHIKRVGKILYSRSTENRSNRHGRKEQ